ncbi:hypothetical protein A2524_03105 [Candidatus Wolfebacteria bacterium RIFOXYD12_FULL_48_21]|uniref:DUF5666 domain-containing protein n=1 Tax=Candidatus Wolfebacteria bacterium RIFOXYD1_FULL_48_65 TaxID=1802561 RepID=A0A1F8E049_9BACT|nr:MAG: hypothetical protein A2610_03410 [Candidatus Wolfebacteria bacterium RIFOXYD1_FULL_48_65]OGM95050.1 MAG: hypothetical protein A2524_03105 [Candidatus Wolfebacteria bacterium RIFOXYD12_FULL_48_21]OGM97821.1 MAG: hypothetical protein A2532_04530 [Candidatus Wolfebacteria bacterium RIFOXYD2_FULL_48_11]
MKKNILLVALFLAVAMGAYALMEHVTKNKTTRVARSKVAYQATVMADVSVCRYYPEIMYAVYICVGDGLGSGECRVRSVAAEKANVPLEKGDNVTIYTTGEDPMEGRGLLTVSRIEKTR